MQANAAELEVKLESYVKREKELRNQLKSLKDAKLRLEDVEAQLGDRSGSSSGHARRESELRNALRDAKIELENVQIESQEKEERLQILTHKEKELRERLKKARADDTIQLDFQNQLADTEAELEVLTKRLHDRERALQNSQKRESELKHRIRSLQSTADNDRTLDQKQWSTQLEAREKRHEGELKGLAKQIQFLRARCEREEGFRKGLVWTKRWFLMQVDMYNQWYVPSLPLHIPNIPDPMLTNATATQPTSASWRKSVSRPTRLFARRGLRFGQLGSRLLLC